MSVVRTYDRLTLAEMAPMIRANPMKDKTYRKTPIGVVVGRFIRWFGNEWGATESSVRDYEAILARMAIALADRQLLEVTTEDLREVIDLWGGQSSRTRAKVTSVIHKFWSWCEDESLVVSDPARRIKRPRADRRVARVLPLDARPRLLTVAKHPRDRLGLFCLLVLGLRRNELCGIQFRDFDADRGWLRVTGKGRKERVLPLRGPILAELRLCLSADLPHVGRPPQGDDYLLFPSHRVADGRGPEGQYFYTFRGEPKTRPSPQAVHRWWYRHAQAAGLVGPDTTAGLNMHRARHTFAMELRRVAGLDAASHALGHSDLSTTLGIYGHFDQGDLETAMQRYAAWLESQNVPPESEDE